jgi:hypothetical protein
MAISVTYDHRTLKTRLPVRSALFKQRTGGLVVRWVTTSEYPLLYVFCIKSVLSTFIHGTNVNLPNVVCLVVNLLVGVAEGPSQVFREMWHHASTCDRSVETLVVLVASPIRSILFAQVTCVVRAYPAIRLPQNNCRLLALTMP